MVAPTLAAGLRILCVCASVPFMLLLARAEGGATARASATPVLEDSLIRAAFIHKFLLFTDFPARAFSSESEPITICAWAAPGDVVALEPLENKNARGRPLRVRQLSDTDRAKHLEGCHVLFVGLHSSVQATRSLLAATQGKPILTVGEHDGFLDWNGIIRLLVRDGRMAFEVNVASARRADISFRAQMLRVAEKVVE
jgi:hypothetical protein